jgi:hypothetical protein
MTRWQHKCDLTWLKDRQGFLTATDVKQLLPVTATGRKRTITDEHYLKVMAGKLVNLTESDCISTGAAARGHILEPYAIDRYNEEDYGSNTHLYHWDDAVISRVNPVLYSLAFSPDACDKTATQLLMDKSLDINVIGEVKSYGPERHLICGYTPKDKLEERWQIATAMAVSLTIREAYLLFYNPSMAEQLYIVDYTREDLASEINTVLEVEGNWLKWIGKFMNANEHYTVLGNKDEELAIIRNITKNEELNPENERSVTL